MLKLLYSLLIVLVGASSVTQVQGAGVGTLTPWVDFQQLEGKDGLSNNQVNAIIKDSYGFVWFGTASGLNRWDGYEVKVYRTIDDDPCSLPDNYITSIQEDACKRLWIGTDTGYACYDPVTDTFDPDVNGILSRYGIMESPKLLYIAPNKDLWICGFDNTIYHICAEGTVRSVTLDSTESVTSLAQSDNQIIAVMNRGLLLAYDADSLKPLWRNESIGTDGRWEHGEVFSVYADSYHRLWVYNIGGVWCLDLDTQQWLMSRVSEGQFNPVRHICQDAQGNIWIGRDQDGIEIMSREGASTMVCHDVNNSRSLANNTITALYADSLGTMWVGTLKNGVSYYNPCAHKFRLDPWGDVNCLEQTLTGNALKSVWMGTNGQGLVRWDAATQRLRSYSHATGQKDMPSDIVVCLMRDHADRIWAGTFWGGLFCFNDNAEGPIKLKTYRLDRQSPSKADNIWSLAEDDQNHIWVGTLGDGLYCLDPLTGAYERYVIGATEAHGYISSLCVGQHRNLVIGSAAGVSFMDLKTRQVRALESGRALYNVNQVYEDSRGLLWIASRSGLDVYDAVVDTLYNVPLYDEYKNVYTLGITEDTQRNLWVSCGAQLINVVPEVNPQTRHYSFKSYSYSDKDGLQSCDFNQRSLKTLANGEVWAGGYYGVNHFVPAQILLNKRGPKVMFTDLRLFNEEVPVGKDFHGKVLLHKPLSEIEELRLEYSQNVFSIGFATDNYIVPEKNTFEYRLEPFNKSWLNASNQQHSATYTNLAPGTYYFRVRAANGDGFEGREEASLKIVICPPFWRTTWAYCFYVLLFMAVLSLCYWYIRQRERRKFRIRQIARDAHKIEELNQLKFRFFTNVSHELRTPLTLILSPLETMLSHCDDKTMRLSLEMMHRNALRLLNLVNQLLDFRKSEQSDLHLHQSDGDIIGFVSGICNSFVELSDKKDIHLTFYSPMKSLFMAFDKDKISKVMMNLLSNAFKFTPGGGRVDVAVVRQEAQLQIRVADTGIGIPDADKQRIFERFYQVENAQEHVAGSGIGLSLVRDYVALHGGRVEVCDNVGGGTVMIVSIPVHETASPAVPAAPAAPTEEPATEVESPASPTSEKLPMVLLVDDNEDFRQFMELSMSAQFDIVTAPNGEQALQLLTEVHPDIIVSDLMMPVMDGKALCKAVKNDKPTQGIPFILLTAKHSVDSKVEALTMGADDYVTKPFNMEELLLKMHNLILLSKQKQPRTRIEPEPSSIEITSLDEKLIDNAVKYVEENMERSDFSVEELSQQLGMSRAHLYKKLMQITGKSPIEFIRVIRIKRAAQMLEKSQMNISEIAYAVGMNNPKAFTKYFKEQYGVLPTEYKDGKRQECLEIDS